METWLGEVRRALRRLRRVPGFAGLAVLMLGLGIGATTGVFSLVDGILLRPLPYPQSQDLVSLHVSIPQFAQQYPAIPVSAGLYANWRRDSRLIDSIALIEPATMDLTGNGAPAQIQVMRVSASVFQVLRQGPRLGRAFLPQEDAPGANHEVILSDASWRNRFHTDRNILGRTVELNGQANQVVGVMPPGFQFPHGDELGPFLSNNTAGPVEVWQPLGLDVNKADTVGEFNYGVWLRLRPGVSLAQLRAELEVSTARAVAAAHMANMQIHVVVAPLRDQVVGNHGTGLWLLLAAVVAVLAIACLNLANLALVRVLGRRHEAAIRMALGASPGRLVRETLWEGAILSLCGAAIGVVAATVGLRWLAASGLTGMPRLGEVHMNVAAVAVAAGLAVASTLGFSLGPALRAGRAEPQLALRAGARGTIGARSGSGRAWLIGAQCALTALLLAVAGLLIASYSRLLNVDKGFQTSRVIHAGVEWSAGKGAQRVALYQAALQKLQTLPGVRTAGLISVLPTEGSGDTDLFSRPHDTRPFVERPLANRRWVSPDYFATLGIPLLRGRTFSAAEMAAAAAPHQQNVAAIVSELTAQKAWPGQNPIGQQYRWTDNDGPTFTVIGVVGDVRSENLATPPPMSAYEPFTLNPPGQVEFALRTSAAPAALAAGIRAAIWSTQPNATIPTIESLDDLVASSVSSRRLQLSLVGMFALCALLLAALGIYGVVAQTVARRTGEIGLRLTLGAHPTQVFAMVLRQAMTPVLAGAGCGIIAALAGGKLLASLLFGVQATDPVVLAGVLALLLGIGALACLGPARRATGIDPLTALRAD
ncbi:MAG TPA: ABC transporter permease [Terriglobales bacterium]|nr:ABC transporter permease [Terriglobales bacterium]